MTKPNTREKAWQRLVDSLTEVLELEVARVIEEGAEEQDASAVGFKPGGTD